MRRSGVLLGATTLAVVAATFLPFGLLSASAAHRLEIVAHRGGSEWGPESTLVDFGHAIRAGADAIEFDIRLTRDRVPVVLHDRTLDRTTDCQGPVAGYTFRELQDCDAGSWFDESFAGERVPSLHQALAYLKGHSSRIKLFLHVKDNDASEASAIMSEVNSTGWNDDRLTVIGSGEGILATMRAAGARRLGYVFSSAAGWNSNYPVLIPDDVKVTRARVAAAQLRGQLVLPIQGHPDSLEQMGDLGAGGMLANDLDDALDLYRGSGHKSNSHDVHHDHRGSDTGEDEGGDFGPWGL
jgi:hypothetical protein